MTSSQTILVVQSGCIVRKRRFHRMVSLALKPEKKDSSDDDDRRNNNKKKEHDDNEPPTLVMVSRDDPCMAWCVLGAWIRVELKISQEEDGTATEKCTRNDEDPVEKKDEKKKQNDSSGHTEAVRVELLQCSPDPNVIPICLQLVAEGALPLSVFSNQTHLQDVHQVEELLRLPPRDKQRKDAIIQISRQLKHGVDNNNHQKTGPLPHIKRWQWQILERLEQNTPLVVPVPFCRPVSNSNGVPEDNSDPTSSTDDPITTKMNVPDVNSMSIRHGISRVDYLKGKKWPQIRWLLQRLQPMMLDDGCTTTRVLDVGGGRGDLAVAVALAFPQAHVTVVDSNESSLLAGRSYAQQSLGLSADKKTSFVCADFATYAAQENHNFDVIVAWHACGDLSDCALQFALSCQANFVICPCCYTKRYITGFEPCWIRDHNNNNCIVPSSSEQRQSNPQEEIAIVQKLAETNNHPEVSQRAMKLINCMRLHALLLEQQQQSSKQQPHDNGTVTIDSNTKKSLGIRLERYESTFSSKNLVLVGEWSTS
ncbi:S-transferase C-terminal domain-containing protein [Seminavis robusta]|uniref:S-transferase C-terminal domain-containing protein n=1 Tax=Seminavis robusta TaxID=568900 RepID=A0A9N8DHK7_9STRA|nr:S-transferase C-terminal domain-containing protein [Seminavis robusta]|eukprot:Sro162_g072910.1 S-transferase C-terminal domain-containing protein (537) ;mRNA; r:68895-70505